MFYADKPRRSEKSRDISLGARIGEKYAVSGFTVSTRVEHAQVVLAQRKQNGSVPAPKIDWVSQQIRWYLRLFDIRQYFNGNKIRRILKLYGSFFFTKWNFGANGILRSLWKHLKPCKSQRFSRIYALLNVAPNYSYMILATQCDTPGYQRYPGVLRGASYVHIMDPQKVKTNLITRFIDTCMHVISVASLQTICSVYFSTRCLY